MISNQLRALRRSAQWRLLFGVIWAADRRLAAAWWTLTVVRAVLPPALAVATGWLVGRVAGDGRILLPLVAVGTLFAAMQILGPLQSQLAANLGDRAAALLQDRLLVAATRPDGIAHLEDPELAGDFTLARDFDLGIVSPRLATSMPFIASGLAAFGAGIVSAFVVLGYAWWAGLLLLAAWLSPHLLLRESYVWKDWRSAEIKDHQRHADYSYRMAVGTPAAKEIRLFGLADWVADRFADRRAKLLTITLEALRMRQRSVVLTLTVLIIANGVVFGSLAWSATHGGLDLSRLIAFAGNAVGVSALARMEFDWWLADGSRPVPVVEDLLPAMRSRGSLRPPAAAGAGPSTGSSTGSRIASGGGTAGSMINNSVEADVQAMPRHQIELIDVSFGYGDAPPVLDGLDLIIPAGGSLAVVGNNGAGKTTLVKLLGRLYDPTGGRIVVDGVDLVDLPPQLWRRQVSAAFQDFVRYHLSLAENVAPTGADPALITDALQRAGAGQLASLDTVLSKQYAGGTDLSGGQWQRVALARALAKVALGARMIILDEPTAQLDVRGEAEVFSSVLRATRGLTTVLVSHRFSTVRQADRICVLEHGRVAELGTHQELMAAGGRYCEMFTLQAARFEEHR